MKAIRIPYVNIKLNTRKLRNHLNYQTTMLLLFLLANVAVSFGRPGPEPGVTIENDRNLITMPDDFNLSQLSALLSEGGEIIQNEDDDLNQNQNHNTKSSVMVNAKTSESETNVRNNVINKSAENIDDIDSGEIINLIQSKSEDNANSNFDAKSLELLRKLHRALLRGRISTTSTTPAPAPAPVPTTTTISSTSKSSTEDTVTISRLKLKNYLKYFVHPHQAENLKKLLGSDSDAEDQEEKEKASEKKVDFKTKKLNSKTQADFVPLSKPEPELSESLFMNKLKARKLGINIPVIRLKVDDRVPLMGRLEIKVNAEELKPFCWALVTFIVLLVIAIVLGCVFGVLYLRKMQTMQYQDFQNQTQNQLKELNSRGCTSRSVSVRDRERHSARLPPSCRCGCEDDLTKTHIADIIRGDPDRDSGTSSHVGCSSIV